MRVDYYVFRKTSSCMDFWGALQIFGALHPDFIAPPQPRPYGVEALFRDNQGNWFSLTQHG